MENEEYNYVTLNTSFQVFRLELSLVPAEDASQNSHGIHPNLLSITIKDKNKRIKYRGNLTNPKAWKLVLLITNGQVYYQDHEGNLLKADDLVNGNKLLLGKSYLKLFRTATYITLSFYNYEHLKKGHIPILLPRLARDS